MDNEYCEEYARIRRNNRRGFRWIAGGLAVLAIGAHIYSTHLDATQSKKQGLLDKISNGSALLIGAASVLYTRREYMQLENLDKSYYGREEDQ